MATGVWIEVIGQAERIAPLQRAVSNPESLTHAWLITGPPGSGRSVAARAFAAALQCTSQGCGECKTCLDVRAGSHPDVTVFATAAVNIGIEAARELISVASRRPTLAPWRIIIVEDADRMTERTANVLLKAIEEPPPRVIWVLCAPAKEDVIVTVRSRCRGVQLALPPAASVAELLQQQSGVSPELALASAWAAQSHVGVARRLATNPDARAHRELVLNLARVEPGVTAALAAADQLVAAAQAEVSAIGAELDEQERDELLQALGAAGGTRVPPHVRAQLRQLEEDQKRRQTRLRRDVLDRAIVDLLSLYRDVAVLQVDASMPWYNQDHEELVRQVASAGDLQRTLGCVDALYRARTRLAANVAPQLAMEALVLELKKS